MRPDHPPQSTSGGRIPSPVRYTSSSRLSGNLRWTMKARLIQAAASDRGFLLCGPDRGRPVVGDIGETDQCFTGADGRAMVLVYFVSADGKSEWELEAYESELEPVEAAAPPPDALT